MLKRFSLKRIIKILLLFLVVFLLQIFPDKKTYDLKIKETIANNKYHTIYLLDKNNMLSKTNIAVNSVSKEKLAIELIESLIIDGKYNDRMPNGFKAVLPINTKINSIKIEDDLIKVDFSNLFYETTNNEEEIIIESLIYTLTSIKNINKISILLDNKILTVLPKSNKKIDEVLTRNYGINKEYNINSIKNIQNVTIYYVSKFNDNTYYVPVTKYLNSEKNKINIIVEELSSRMGYNTNLMSYLNTNASLIDYQINDDNIVLNFNEYLFDNKEKNEVLEEVIYTIKYSMEDTYNIKNVTFLVNNKEIKR